MFYKRLYEHSEEVSVFAVGSFQLEQPDILVARHLMQNKITLDSRGVFIVLLPSKVVIWVGVHCTKRRKVKSIDFAK